MSHQTTADIADALAEQKLPMVSDVVTAEGFDQTGSREDAPDFRSCDADITYPRDVGKGYSYLVAFRAAKQVEEIAAVLPATPGFIAVPTGGSDPYTCTALPLIHRAYGPAVPEVKFDSVEPTTVPQTARRICPAPTDTTVIYLARGRNLGRLLYSFGEAYSNGQCAAPSVTVVSTSDGNRMRTVEADPALEGLRNQALKSGSLRSGRIRLPVHHGQRGGQRARQRIPPSSSLDADGNYSLPYDHAIRELLYTGFRPRRAGDVITQGTEILPQVRKR
ncbi:hypothetical protein AB0M34_35660 [Nocardia sp. NPDC050193]